MVRTVLKMRVREGCEQSFEEVWAQAAPEISRYPGHLGQFLMREQDEPRTYVIMADWESARHLDDFEHSPVRQALSAKLTPLREFAQKTVLDGVRELDVRELDTVGENGRKRQS
jgi:heme-degrading monooxygenase HmoA